MKCVDADHSGIKLGIRLQKLPQRLRGHIPATRDGDVRMPGTQIRFQPSGERGFLHAFVDLKQMRVRLADADPNNLRRAFWRKRADAGDREKKCAKLNPTEFFAQHKINCFWNVAEKTKRQMHLCGFSPAHAANLWVMICQQVARWLWQIDRYKNAFGHTIIRVAI